MKRILALFLALFLASAFMAAAPAFAFEEDSMDSQQPEMSYPHHDGRGGGGHYRGCPPGTERRPDYRWDGYHRRWVFVGWTCGRR